MYSYRSRADEYVSQHGLGISKQIHVNNPVNYRDLIESYNDYTNLPQTNKSEVHRRAIINTFDDNRRDKLPQYPHETLRHHLHGNTWEDCLEPKNIALLAALLYESGERNYALEITKDIDTSISESEYESHKNSLPEVDDKQRSDELCKLLPHLPGRSANEIKSIFGQVLYWLAGDISITEHAKYQSHIVYLTAASLLDQTQQVELAEKAAARSTYLLGTHHQFNNRQKQATNHYFTVLDEYMYGENGFIDSYSTFNAVENLVNMEIKQTIGDTDSPDIDAIEASIELLSDVDSRMPHEGVLLSEWKESFRKEAQHHVDAALAELTAEKLRLLSNTDTKPTPTTQQIQSQYRSALDKYKHTDNKTHVNRLKNTINNTKVQ